ncbi:disulfide bond formation protein B [Vibrio sp. SCSIO 43137]|uniref:disulfide bond formation protein B n=1 Tax=Vibrio sp. SCSIO 43137 TaxID=3021011 RepID=UPI0023076B93|nr:disulfide bond formation protein B [Vibrio sp. SCSIO 43137]WCE28478.1 disulfide bond formation protein B [Vibrio sp. SCSIO 43137]
MKTLTNSTLVGAFLILSSVGMELFGLFTQHYLGFEPCANCVQIRLFILFIGIAGLLHLFSADSYITKISTLLLATISTWFSLQFSWDNHLIETGQKLSGCSSGSPFPDFLPLDFWLPGMFEAKGPCGTPATLFGNTTFTDLSIFGLSILLALLTLVLVTNLFKLKDKAHNETK